MARPESESSYGCKSWSRVGAHGPSMQVLLNLVAEICIVSLLMGVSVGPEAANGTANSLLKRD